MSFILERLHGEGGIRTPDKVLRPYNGLANRRLQPLGHLSRGVIIPAGGSPSKANVPRQPARSDAQLPRCWGPQLLRAAMWPVTHPLQHRSSRPPLVIHLLGAADVALEAVHHDVGRRAAPRGPAGV